MSDWRKFDISRNTIRHKDLHILLDIFLDRLGLEYQGKWNDELKDMEYRIFDKTGGIIIENFGVGEMK